MQNRLKQSGKLVKVRLIEILSPKRRCPILWIKEENGPCGWLSALSYQACITDGKSQRLSLFSDVFSQLRLKKWLNVSPNENVQMNRRGKVLLFFVCKLNFMNFVFNICIYFRLTAAKRLQPCLVLKSVGLYKEQEKSMCSEKALTSQRGSRHPGYPG